MKSGDIELETAAFIKSLGLPTIDDVTSSKSKGNKNAAEKPKPVEKNTAKAVDNKAKPSNKPKPTNDKKAAKENKDQQQKKGTPNKQSKPTKMEKKHASKQPDTWVLPTAAAASTKKTVVRAIPWLVAPVDAPGCIIDMPENTNWYTLGVDISKVNPTDHRIDKASLQHICDTVSSIYEEDQAKYQQLKASNTSADQKWINNIIKTGTLSDKVAALAMQITKAPVYELDTLDILIAMATKKEQRTQQLALEALKDLLLHNLLPDRRRLRPIRNQPLGYPEMTLETAILCHFEDLLIPRISAIVDALEAGLRSTVEYFRRVCMEMIADWLVGKPEQEARLLSMLVNKLGDPITQNCSKAMSLLRKVIYHHAAMKVVVVKEVRQFTMRPNLPPRATYSAILLLSQIPVADARRDSEVAEHLIECYLGLFEKAVGMDEVGSKLLSALLAGINRVFPFLQSTEAIVRHMDVLFKIVHTGAFSTSTQSLMLISHIALQEEASKSESHQQLIDRYYRALYSKLLSDQLFTRTHNSLFLNLLFRSMKRDPSMQRVMAFVKRVMICSTQSSPPIAAGLLFLISEVCKVRPELLSMITQPEETDETGDDYHKIGNFDAGKLAPEFSCTETPGMWELCLHMFHFHPSVKAFATSLAAEDHAISFDGDPTVE